MSKLNKQHLLYWTLEVSLVALIIWLGSKISFVFSPAATFISSVFTPLLISGVLFYLLNPIINLMSKIKIKKHRFPRTLAIIIVFAAIICLLVYLIMSFVPDLMRQVTNLVNNIPDLSSKLQKMATHAARHGWLKHLPVKSYAKKLQTMAYSHSQNMLKSLTANLSNVLSTITSIIVNIITIPIMLFYMLKDGSKLRPDIAKFIPKKHRKHSMVLLKKMNHTLSRYIGGQMIECIFVSTFTIIGYLFIHQSYAVPLGLFVGFCDIMPYVGPYIGIAPSLCVALATAGVKQLIWVLVIVIIVQQLDGNFVYPNVVGKAVQVHPLTIIIILLAAGNIAGVIGMILAVPLYAIIKTVIIYLHSIYVANQTV